MRTDANSGTKRRLCGQTLIIAIIIMGVLLILAVAFMAIVSQSVTLSGDSLRRAEANDLARGGIVSVHARMLSSTADAVIASTNPTVLPDFTKDPDAMYLRPPSFLVFPSPSLNVVDLGGPDGLGTYRRIEFDKGRALVRVRYAPSDFDAFADPTGALRQPGRARQYLIIESIGRPGRVTVSGRTDPTRQLSRVVRIRGYADTNELAIALGQMHAVDSGVLPSRKMIAFATIGIGDHAMFITDKHQLNRPVDMGWPTGDGGLFSSSTGVGAYFRGAAVNMPTLYGQLFANPAAHIGNVWTTPPGGGGFRSNAPMVYHGVWDFSLNAWLGEGIQVAGRIRAANSASSLRLFRSDYNAGLDQWDITALALGSAQMDSRAAGFDTFGSVFRDGEPKMDRFGYPRHIRPIAAPSIDRVDPQGRDNIYIELTRSSGPIVNGRNIGQWGFGRGVFVDYMNSYNRQRRNDDDRDVNAGSALVDMWFNPNARDTSPRAGSWEGPYFVPDAAYLRLLPDGFSITRPGNAGEQQNSDQAFWRDPVTGLSTGLSVCRYRIREIPGQGVWILNSIQHTELVGRAGAALNDADFLSFGLPFEGLIYFEGDVRVRGVIPTQRSRPGNNGRRVGGGHQLTVISMGTIYIDGSITKGVVDEFGTVISEPSRSMISLLARDHIAVNTTQFFAPVPNDLFDTKDDSPLPDTPSPLELGVDGDSGVDSDVLLHVQLLLSGQSDPMNPFPVIDPTNPLTWQPLATRYREWNSATTVGADIDVFMMLASAANDGGPSYVSLGISPRTFADPAAATETAYLFSRFLDFGVAGPVVFNAADPFFLPGTKIPIYGLADPSTNVFPKFETIEFPLVTRAGWTYSSGQRRLVPAGGNAEGQYQLGLNDETELRLRNNVVGSAGQKEFLVARTAVTPHDIRIEASMYAQEGSFYVIPGPWFNMNTDDTRERFELEVGAAGRPEAQRRRFERFGNTPHVPFHAEPIDCRVSIVGAITQNLPAPISRQAEWLQKWGWIPMEIGGTGRFIPWQHVPEGFDLLGHRGVPNFIVIHDTALAGASADGGLNPLRTDIFGRALPPTPRLPVSPTLVYFGEVNP